MLQRLQPEKFTFLLDEPNVCATTVGSDDTLMEVCAVGVDSGCVSTASTATTAMASTNVGYQHSRAAGPRLTLPYAAAVYTTAPPLGTAGFENQWPVVQDVKSPVMTTASHVAPASLRTTRASSELPNFSSDEGIYKLYPHLFRLNH